MNKNNNNNEFDITTDDEAMMALDSTSDDDCDDNTTFQEKFMTHIYELRNRLLICLTAFIFNSAIAYLFAQHILVWLMKPLQDITHRALIYTQLPEVFLTFIKIALFTGFIATLPVMFFHIWRFVAAGLYQNERKILRIIVIASPILFAIGGAFAYFGIIPLAWKFFASFEITIGAQTLVHMAPKVSQYLSLIMQFIIAFGLCFQLPLLLIILVKIGVMDINTLVKNRRIALLLILVISAFLTPPDVVSMLGLATPVYILYEMSIFLLRIL